MPKPFLISLSALTVFVLTLPYLSFGQGSDVSIVKINIEGGISAVVAEYVADAVKFADEKEAKLLLVELDTPGGSLDATRKIVKEVLGSNSPVAVYVTPQGARAGSAGVFITLSAHIAAMAPSTNIGAAHPVSMFGGNIEGDMAKKVENDAAAWARSLAEKHNRNTEWAEKAVLESASISSKEALKNGIIDIIATSQEDLLKQIEGRTVVANEKEISLSLQNARVEVYEMTSRQAFMKWLSNPNLLYVVMLLGFFFLFLEYMMPGAILPVILGVLFLALVFGIQILPVNAFGVLLIVGAVALLIAELFITSYGLLTAGAVVLLVSGSYLLFDVEGSTFQVDPMLIWTLAVCFTLLIIFVGVLILRAKGQGGTSGIDAMVGTIVKVTRTIDPISPGQVKIQGSYWTAESKESVQAGERVRVVRVTSTRVLVEKL